MSMADHEDRGPHSLEDLAALDSCVLSDALDRLDLPGAVAGIGPLSAGRRITGRAVTVKLGPAGPGRSGRHLCTAAVESGGPGSVARVLAARESEMALAVKRGEAVSAVMGSTYEQLLQRAEGGR